MEILNSIKIIMRIVLLIVASITFININRYVKTETYNKEYISVVVKGHCISKSVKKELEKYTYKLRIDDIACEDSTVRSLYIGTVITFSSYDFYDGDDIVTRDIDLPNHYLKK